MIEAIIAFALLIIGFMGGNDMLIMASGLFAIATNLSNIHDDLKKG